MTDALPPEDDILAYYTHAVFDLYQQLESSQFSDTPEIAEKIEALQSEVADKIDTWMALDEQIEELTQQTVAPAAQTSSPSPEKFSQSPFPSGVDTSINTEDPQNFSFRKAMAFYDLWMFEEAAGLFKQVLRFDETNLAAALFYAASETAQGKYHLAEPYLSAIRRSGLQKYQCAAEEISAFAAYQKGHVEESIQHLLQVVQWLPDTPDGWFNLGLCYAKLGDWPGAAGALSQSVELDPQDGVARLLLIDVWMEMQEYDAALGQVLEALRLQPGNLQLSLRKARIFKHRGQLADAQQVYKNILLQDPSQHFVLDEYADVCLEQGKTRKAAAIVKKSLTLRKNSQHHLLKLALIELSDHQITIAQRILEQLPSESQFTPLATLCKARIQLKKGELRKAATLAGSLLHVSGGPVRNLAMFYYSRFLQETGHAKAAARMLRQIHRI